MSVIEKLASEGHLTAEQVERIGKNVADFMEAVETDPSFRKEAMEKLSLGLPTYLKEPGLRTGFLKKTLGHMYDIAPVAAAGAALGGAFGMAQRAGESGLGAATGRIQKASRYKKMVEANPDLGEADPQVTQRAFSTLHKFNPEYASDPMVAGTFVRNVVDQERLDIGAVNSLVQARKSMADQKRPSDTLALATGMGKAMGEHHKSEKAFDERREAHANFLGAQARLKKEEEAYRQQKAGNP